MFRTGVFRILSKQLKKYGINVLTVQEMKLLISKSGKVAIIGFIFHGRNSTNFRPIRELN